MNPHSPNKPNPNKSKPLQTKSTITMCESFKREYQLCEEIGRGRFGIVYRCYSAASATSLAVKSIDKRLLLDDDTDRQCLHNEPKILQFLSPHPNILRIHAIFDSDSHLLIVTDLCQENTLYDRILANSTPFSEVDAAPVFKQLVDAIAHCHRHYIAHRDIKPENILFDSRNRLKLCDFGSAEWFGGSETEGMTGVVGTPYYVAPEVLAGREYNEKVDVWSVGVILYIMLAGVPPFYGESVEETFEAVIRANLRFPPRIFRSVSPQAKDLLRKMLCKDASRRFSADQVLRHPWMINGGVSNTITDMT